MKRDERVAQKHTRRALTISTRCAGEFSCTPARPTFSAENFSILLWTYLRRVELVLEPHSAVAFVQVGAHGRHGSDQNCKMSTERVLAVADQQQRHRPRFYHTCLWKSERTQQDKIDKFTEDYII